MSSRDLYIGIDPGRKGAIAVVCGDELVDWLSFHKLNEDWECDVVMLDDYTICEFLKKHIPFTEAIAIEVPKATTYGGKTKVGSIADLRGNVTQLMQITKQFGTVRRLVDPQSWQGFHGFEKTPDKKVKQVVLEAFKSSVKHDCEHTYQLEGVADAFYIAQWVRKESKKEALSCA